MGNPDPAIRKRTLDHILDCVAIADALECRDVSPWFADGSNYPGTQSIRNRIGWFEEALKKAHASLNPKQRLLIEYKPFEPAFYHTDIADWGMAFLLARNAGPQAYVLVDTGHHYQAQNIEQIVAWLLHHKMIGGFHFNDRRYADDDLTLGSIDPYQIFRIFHEIHNYAWETGAFADVAYMVDQSHNLKGKMEAMIQTVCTAQELYAKAAIVDHARLASLQQKCSLVEAEEMSAGGVLVRCASGPARMASQPWSAGRPDAGVPGERLHGADHRRAEGPQCSGRDHVCLRLVTDRAPELVITAWTEASSIPRRW